MSLAASVKKDTQPSLRTMTGRPWGASSSVRDMRSAR